MDGQIVEKEETDCNIGVFWDLFILTFFNQSCWSLLFVTLNVTLGKHILSPRTNVLTYFSDVWLDGAKIAKKHICDCLIPRGPSLSMKICAQREAGRRKPPRRRFSSLLSPSHGPSRFVTSHSRFALTFVRKTKRLRRRQCLRHVSGKLPTYPFHVILFFFTLYSRTAWSKYRQGESWTTWPSWITWTNWIAWTIRPERHTMKYSILKLISSLTKNKFFTNRNTVTPFPYTPLKKMKTKAKMCAKNTLLCIS